MEWKITLNERKLILEGTHVPCPWLRRKSKKLQSTVIVVCWDEDGTCLCAASWWQIFSCEHWHPSHVPLLVPLKIRPFNAPKVERKVVFTTTLFFRASSWYQTGVFAGPDIHSGPLKRNIKNSWKRLVFRLQKNTAQQLKRCKCRWKHGKPKGRKRQGYLYVIFICMFCIW